MPRFHHAAAIYIALMLMLTIHTASQAAEPTQLVVTIVVDQFRGDYLEVLQDHFVEGGFKRFMRDGAWYTNARYSYGTLATGPGHASLLTGSVPSVHGIVANTWYNQDDQPVYCCEDKQVTLLGLPPNTQGQGRSPRLLRVATLGDQIKIATNNRGKVWSVALKDRAAVLTAGHRADGAIWWDSHSGNFITSTYYSPNLPAWVSQLNKERFVDRRFKQSWDRLLPVKIYDAVRYLDGAPEEAYRATHPNKFPKILGGDTKRPGHKYYKDLYASPFGNELVFEAARRLIKAESLGADADIDQLTIGLSSNDLVGHLYGPGSHEVTDCTLRTDRQLAEFLTWLDKQVGLSRCLIALSSDHGVGPIAEYAIQAHVGGGRLQRGEIAAHVDKALRAQFGKVATSRSLVRGIAFPWVYLDRGALKSAGISLDDAARTAANALPQMEGIQKAFPTPDIRAPGFAGSDPLRRAVVNSYDPQRSGQVYLHWKRYWYIGKKTAGHGSAYDYDQHVPVLFLGRGVVPGRHSERVCPTGMVPTLCALLNIAAPDTATGKVYSSALRAPATTTLVNP